MAKAVNKMNKKGAKAKKMKRGTSKAERSRREEYQKRGAKEKNVRQKSEMGDWH